MVDLTCARKEWGFCVRGLVHKNCSWKERYELLVTEVLVSVTVEGQSNKRVRTGKGNCFKETSFSLKITGCQPVIFIMLFCRREDFSNYIVNRHFVDKHIVYR